MESWRRARLAALSTMPIVELKVKGMMCEGCTGGVEKALSKLDYVNSVKAEFTPADKVTLDLKDDADLAEIKAKITKMGHEIAD